MSVTATEACSFAFESFPEPPFYAWSQFMKLLRESNRHLAQDVRQFLTFG